MIIHTHFTKVPESVIEEKPVVVEEEQLAVEEKPVKHSKKKKNIEVEEFNPEWIEG